MLYLQQIDNLEFETIKQQRFNWPCGNGVQLRDNKLWACAIGSGQNLSTTAWIAPKMQNLDHDW